MIWIASLAMLPLFAAIDWPTQGWKEATPESQGLDSAVLAQASDFIREKRPNIHSLLIVRHGRVVLDRYFEPYRPGTPHDGASVTKSVMSALIGIAIDKGVLQDVHQPVLGKVDIEHLVSMSSGLECGFKPGEAELAQMKLSPDWVEFSRQLQPRYAPGEKFGYCSPGFHLLSATLSKAAGVSTLEFARENLFQPLGIREVLWPADPQSRNTGWGNLHLLPRDFAKIGYLYLHGGEWDGKQIVSKAWVSKSISPFIEARKDVDYGYGWWIYNHRTPRLYEANGRGGQRIIVIPDEDMIVVFTGGGFEPAEIGEFVLRSIRSQAALPTAGISGKKYVLEANLMDLKSISLTFDGPMEARAVLQVAHYPAWSARVGLDGEYRFSPDGHLQLPVAAKGWWESGHDFVLDLNLIANINHYRIAMHFTGNDVQLTVNEATGQLHNLVIAGKVENPR